MNDSDKTIDTEIGSSQLFVNGKAFKHWLLCINNGPRDERRNALPPGEFLHFGFLMNEHFEKPGVYKVRWKGKAFETREIEFRVLAPEKK